MSAVIPVEYAKLIFPRRTLHPTDRRYTPESDTQVVLWLASLSDCEGSIVEIGCSDGTTLLELALNFPERLCVGVDDGKPHPNQETEIPKYGRPGWMAQDQPNVRIFPVAAEDWKYESLEVPASFVFIDAQHTYESCGDDTFKAWQHMEKRPGLKVIAWHDYAEDRPEYPWLGVKKAVQSFVEWSGLMVWHVNGTAVAFTLM
jgi:hypothetical protein